jgi:hypothetical protein
MRSENKQNLLLNSQIPVKQNFAKEDYVLITAQDKNIQKDYIVEVENLQKELLANAQEQFLQNIKVDKNIKVTKSGNTLHLAYDDSAVQNLIQQNAEQIQELIALFSSVTSGVGLTQDQILDLINQRISIAENSLNAKIDATNLQLSVIDQSVAFLKDNVTDAVEQRIEVFYNDALDYVDTQNTFNQVSVGETITRKI